MVDRAAVLVEHLLLVETAASSLNLT